MMNIRSLAPATAILALVLLAGCSDDASSEPSEPASSASEDVQTDDADASGDDLDADLPDYCAGVIAFAEGDFLEDIDQTDANALGATLVKVTDDARKVDVPDDIADDWDVMLNAIDALADATDGLDLTSPDDIATFNTAIEEIGSEGVDTASSHVSDFIDSNCS